MRAVGGPGTEPPPSDWPEDGRGGMGTFCWPTNRNMLMKYLINSSFNQVRRKINFYPCMPLEYTEDIFKIVRSLSSDSVNIIKVTEYCYTG